MCYHVKQTRRDRDYLENSFGADLRFEVIPTYYHVNGFQRPTMMIITQEEPEVIQLATWSVAPPNCFDVLDYWKTKGGSCLNTRDDSLFSYKSAEWKSEAALDKKCLMIVTGFYEPHKVGKDSYPFLLHQHDFEPFGLLGYYTEQEDYLTCSILTTSADELLSKVHNAAKRMPITVLPEEKENYLDISSEEELKDIFSRPHSIPLNHRAVDRSVLNSRIDSNIVNIVNEVQHPVIFDF